MLSGLYLYCELALSMVQLVFPSGWHNLTVQLWFFIYDSAVWFYLEHITEKITPFQLCIQVLLLKHSNASAQGLGDMCNMHL